jgi:RNA polymerase sigma-70 factor (ECF subfamily)
MKPAAAQVQFTQKERDFVFSVAMKYMRDEDRARDVTQDALLAAYVHRDSFRGEARLTTWLYRIAATTALMHLRKERRRGQLQTLIDDADEERRPVEPGDPRSSPEDRSGAKEAIALASRSLTEMGDKYGQIFSMRFVEGYSETEIARRLQLRVATVKTRAYRARSRLRETLSRALEPAPERQAA